MAFGGGGRRPVGAGGDLGACVDAIGSAMQALSRVRHRLDAAGAPLAATYVEGALDALSFSMEAALWVEGANGRGSGSHEDAAYVGTARVQLHRDGTGVYADLAKPFMVPPPVSAGPALGAGLAGATDLAAALRDDEVGSGLMAAALAHTDWIHLETGEVFSGDPLAAHAVVATVVGRTSFPSWTRRQMGGLIHRGSADALAGLGWRRMTGAAMPTA